MFKEALLERPSALWSSLLGAFSELERFLNVEEPVRIGTEPVAWVTMDNDKRGESIAVVMPVSDGQFIYLPMSGGTAHYDKACYLKNPTPEVTPNPPIKGNAVPFGIFTKEDKSIPLDKQKNVKEKRLLSPDVLKCLRRAVEGTSPSASLPEAKLA